jgi:hypothetical protein
MAMLENQDLVALEIAPELGMENLRDEKLVAKF